MNNVEFVTMLRRPNGILDYQLRLVCADRIEALAIERDIHHGARRIAVLEAALREIADTKDSKDLGMDEPDTNDEQNMIDTLIWIARRALEGKP